VPWAMNTWAMNTWATNTWATNTWANPVYPEAPPNACQTIANTAIKNIHITMRRPM